MHQHPAVRVFGAIAILAATCAPAAAQRIPFQQTIDVTPGTTLDVSTLQGKVDVRAGESDRVEIAGTVTVRVAWNVPLDAPQIARRVAQHPPIEVGPGVVRLREPSDPVEHRAVIVAYEVRVPRNMPLRVDSDSGAITVRDVAAPVSVTTHSATITLSGVGDADVRTGSGAVTVNGSSGALRVVTSSSAIAATDVRGSFTAETGSGAVRGQLAGDGAVHVRTSSSGVSLEGVSGPATVRTQSGRVLIAGAPAETWDVATGSGSITAAVGEAPRLAVEVSSRSGSVRAEGLSIEGHVSKQKVSGRTGGGGPLIRLASRSGSILVHRGTTEGR